MDKEEFMKKLEKVMKKLEELRKANEGGNELKVTPVNLELAITPSGSVISAGMGKGATVFYEDIKMSQKELEELLEPVTREMIKVRKVLMDRFDTYTDSLKEN